MSTDLHPELLTREEHAEAIVVQIRYPLLREGDQLAAVRDALFREVEAADRPLVLDLTAVEFLTSAALGWLLTLRRKLMERGRGFQPPCRRRGLFAIFPNAAAALSAIRERESDPLLLYGVKPSVRDVFLVC
jgi:hypothetical protein